MTGCERDELDRLGQASPAENHIRSARKGMTPDAACATRFYRLATKALVYSRPTSKSGIAKQALHAQRRSPSACAWWRRGNRAADRERGGMATGRKSKPVTSYHPDNFERLTGHADNVKSLSRRLDARQIRGLLMRLSRAPFSPRHPGPANLHAKAADE